MNNIMLDIETMGTNPSSAILAIGAVKFDRYGIGDDFIETVDLQSSMDEGLTLDASTVMWWMNQSRDARSKLFGDSVSLKYALKSFSKWVGEKVVMWGNGVGFDNTILGNAYDITNIDRPWKFWNDRCYRTIKSLYPNVYMDRVGVYHYAVDDAKTQALHLLKIIEENNLGIEL